MSSLDSPSSGVVRPPLLRGGQKSSSSVESVVFRRVDEEDDDGLFSGDEGDLDLPPGQLFSGDGEDLPSGEGREWTSRLFPSLALDPHCAAPPIPLSDGDAFPVVLAAIGTGVGEEDLSLLGRERVDKEGLLSKSVPKVSRVFPCIFCRSPCGIAVTILKSVMIRAACVFALIFLEIGSYRSGPPRSIDSLREHEQQQVLLQQRRIHLFSAGVGGAVVHRRGGAQHPVDVFPASEEQGGRGSRSSSGPGTPEMKGREEQVSACSHHRTRTIYSPSQQSLCYSILSSADDSSAAGHTWRLPGPLMGMGSGSSLFEQCWAVHGDGDLEDHEQWWADLDFEEEDHDGGPDDIADPADRTEGGPIFETLRRRSLIAQRQRGGAPLSPTLNSLSSPAFVQQRSMSAPSCSTSVGSSSSSRRRGAQLSSVPCSLHRRRISSIYSQDSLCCSVSSADDSISSGTPPWGHRKGRHDRSISSGTPRGTPPWGNATVGRISSCSQESLRYSLSSVFWDDHSSIRSSTPGSAFRRTLAVPPAARSAVQPLGSSSPGSASRRRFLCPLSEELWKLPPSALSRPPSPEASSPLGSSSSQRVPSSRSPLSARARSESPRRGERAWKAALACPSPRALSESADPRRSEDLVSAKNPQRPREQETGRPFRSVLGLPLTLSRE